MADRRNQTSENVPGEFFVDGTCINCDTCRQIAPETFDDTGDYSFVFAQPDSGEKTRHALRDFRFEWVLPGHGQRVKLTPAQIRKELAALVKRMANPV